jgi:CBS domain containing-hemolysin-like protein
MSPFPNLPKIRSATTTTAPSAERSKRSVKQSPGPGRPAHYRRKRRIILSLLALLLTRLNAHASIFKGETLDKVADVLTWVVLIVAPIVAIAVFLLIHILPEKIAEKKRHPQTKAIQCLCLLSLVFGGMLWPLAWLWAYTRPVLHKMAYGKDTLEHGEASTELEPAEVDEELKQLWARVHELEAKQDTRPAERGKA